MNQLTLVLLVALTLGTYGGRAHAEDGLEEELTEMVDGSEGVVQEINNVQESPDELYDQTQTATPEDKTERENESYSNLDEETVGEDNGTGAEIARPTPEPEYTTPVPPAEPEKYTQPVKKKKKVAKHTKKSKKIAKAKKSGKRKLASHKKVKRRKIARN